MGQILTSIADLLDLGSDAESHDLSGLATVTAQHFVGDGSGLTNVPLSGVGLATESVSGLMSAVDKTKLDGLSGGGGSGAVSSVAGRTGDVVLAESDISGLVADLATKLVKSANLSDLANAATARTNLGLGTAATQASSAFESAITAGTTSQFWRGDKSWHALLESDITGLVSDLATLASGLAAKEPIITGGTTLQYWRGDKSFQTLNTAIVPESGNLYYTTARVNTDAPNVTIGTASGLSLSGQQLSLAVATSGVTGAFSGTDKTKLDGIASGATANTGTVTSVTLTAPAILSVTGSPITTTGTLALSLANQTGNVVFASPANGTSGTPLFRVLVAADIPAIAESQVTNLTTDLAAKAISTRLISTTAPLAGGGDLSADRTLSIQVADATHDGYLSSVDWTSFNGKESAITGGTTGQYWRGDKSFQTLNATAVGLGSVLNSKQVTAVQLTTPNVIFATPVTWSVDASGNATATLSLNTQTANTILAGPTTGSAANPTFRALVAADIPALAESAITNLTTDLAAKAVLSGGNSLTGDQTVTGAISASKRITSGVVSAGTVSSGTYATDASLGNEVQITLGANTSFSAPTNAVNGQELRWVLTQDGTGSRTLTLATGAGGFQTPTSINVAASTTAAATDILEAEYNSTLNRWVVTRFIRGDSAGNLRSIIATWGNPTTTPTTGQKQAWRAPYSGTIVASTITGTDATGAPVTCSAAVGIAKATSQANYESGTSSSIVASAPPTLSAAKSAIDTTLSGWTVDFAAGEWLIFSLTSVSTANRVTEQIDVRLR